ncbi:Lysine-specific demethylase 8 [Trametes pubescens]|uniref:Lysine-specific demethylase 8 n=1 Tax=Trametes pubescens TaxID=154538 RepID=A0A1M2VX97_TRAPU|nr:Lysine-specific demethylase 8 [Trametes pubescens]
MPAGAREVFRSFVEQLQDHIHPNTAEILACDESSAETLLHAAQLLSGDLQASSSRYGAGNTGLKNLLQHAHAAMASSSAKQLRGWRRVYTDACILLACQDVLDFWVSREATRALSAVSHLDHAIVIAGAAGDGRLDLVLDLIEGIQSECLDRPAAARGDSFFLAPIRDTPAVTPRSLPTAENAVRCLDAPPSLASFLSRYSQEPFVLRGFLGDWPALNEHPWASLDYLRSAAGPGRMVPVEVGGDYRSDDWTQRMMPWEEFLASIGNMSSVEPRPVLYLAQHSLFKQFPALQSDIIVPDYVYSSLSPPKNYPQYVPPSNEEQLVLNAWLGPASTVSPAHTDPFFNFYAQVVGRKTIWLAPPVASPHIYPYPPPSSKESGVNLTCDKSEPIPRNPAANHESPSMSNTTRVDVFPSSPDELAMSHGEFPDFWDKVVPAAMSVTLEPGDLLFFPPGWWHAMRSEEMSFSVSMWF